MVEILPDSGLKAMSSFLPCEQAVACCSVAQVASQQEPILVRIWAQRAERRLPQAPAAVLPDAPGAIDVAERSKRDTRVIAAASIASLRESMQIHDVARQR